MIREALISDLAAVMRISKLSFVGEDAFGAKWLLRELEKPGASLIVDDASATLIRGYMLVNDHALGKIVRLIAVDPASRGQGIGKTLLAEIKGPAYTWVRTENSASLRLFESMLWKDCEPPRKRHHWRYLSLEAAIE